jgi:hypothetical protein
LAISTNFFFAENCHSCSTKINILKDKEGWKGQKQGEGPNANEIQPQFSINWKKISFVAIPSFI